MSIQKKLKLVNSSIDGKLRNYYLKLRRGRIEIEINDYKKIITAKAVKMYYAPTSTPIAAMIIAGHANRFLVRAEAKVTCKPEDAYNIVLGLDMVVAKVREKLYENYVNILVGIAEEMSNSARIYQVEAAKFNILAKEKSFEYRQFSKDIKPLPKSKSLDNLPNKGAKSSTVYPINKNKKK